MKYQISNEGFSDPQLKAQHTSYNGDSGNHSAHKNTPAQSPALPDGYPQCARNASQQESPIKDTPKHTTGQSSHPCSRTGKKAANSENQQTYGQLTKPNTYQQLFYLTIRTATDIQHFLRSRIEKSKKLTTCNSRITPKITRNFRVNILQGIIIFLLYYSQLLLFTQ